MANARHRLLSSIRVAVLLFSCGFALLLCFRFSSEIKSRMVMIDKIFLNGEARNLYGVLVGENWEAVQGLKFKTLSSSDFLLIAHGNGFRNDALENSRGAFQRSKALGLKIFEIDIWTIGEKIYCSHDIVMSETACDLSILFEGLEKNDIIISDIKSDFDTTLSALINSQDHVLLQQMIVQLLHPQDALTFSELSSHFRGAIFTLYRSNRRLDHVCGSLNPIDFPLLVIGETKLLDAEKICTAHKFIVHPVKRCDLLKSLKFNNNVSGALVSEEALNCKN